MGREYTYVFIDESGDTGFKFGKGSTQIFCLVAIIFYTTTDIAITEQAIHELKSILGLRKTHEFHFTKEPERIRTAFCNAVMGKPFLIRAIVADKNSIVVGTSFPQTPMFFYNFCTKMLLKYNFGTIANARVYIDGKMNIELGTYLRQELNQEEQLIAECKFKDSKSSPIIQLADMVAGSIARSYHPEKSDSNRYRRILQANIDDIWEFGMKVAG